jgi:hypothetical protein
VHSPAPPASSSFRSYTSTSSRATPVLGSGRRARRLFAPLRARRKSRALCVAAAPPLAYGRQWRASPPLLSWCGPVASTAAVPARRLRPRCSRDRSHGSREPRGRRRGWTDHRSEHRPTPGAAAERPRLARAVLCVPLLFMRKRWFSHLVRALVVFSGGLQSARVVARDTRYPYHRPQPPR